MSDHHLNTDHPPTSTNPDSQQRRLEAIGQFEELVAPAFALLGEEALGTRLAQHVGHISLVCEDCSAVVSTSSLDFSAE